MGHDIRLNDQDGNPVQVPAHTEGGIILVTTDSLIDAEISVTYNYTGLYQGVIRKSLKEVLYGKTGEKPFQNWKLS